MKKYIKKLNGMQIFTLVWFGQLISSMGTAMTKFALMLWAYDQTGKATTTALTGFFNILFFVMISPLAGVLIDRFSRKKIMVIAELGSLIITFSLLILYATGTLQIYHIFAGEALSGLFEAFKVPTFSAAVTMLLPKDNYDKASGMRSFSNNISTVFAPIISSIIISLVGFNAVMGVDLATFLVVIVILISVKIPNPKAIEHRQNTHKPMFEDMLLGIRYLLARRGLFNIMIIFAIINLLSAITYYGILPPMILAKSSNNKLVLASVQAALGIGGVAGSLIVGIVGCPKKKVSTIVWAGCCSFLFGDILLGIGASKYIWIFAAFISSFFIPFIIAAATSLWQSKTEPSIQGRVFSLRAMVEQSIMPLGYILGGVLADYIFEPSMTGNGSLSKIFGTLVGTGKGSGMGVMFIFTGIIGALTCYFCHINKAVRNIEKELPDYDV